MRGPKIGARAQGICRCLIPFLINRLLTDMQRQLECGGPHIRGDPRSATIGRGHANVDRSNVLFPTSMVRPRSLTCIQKGDYAAEGTRVSTKRSAKQKFGTSPYANVPLLAAPPRLARGHCIRLGRPVPGPFPSRHGPPR